MNQPQLDIILPPGILRAFDWATGISPGWVIGALFGGPVLVILLWRLASVGLRLLHLARAATDSSNVFGRMTSYLRY